MPLRKYYKSFRIVIVQSSHHDTVIVAREDWAAIEETIYLNAIPGYIKSIEEAITSPREEWVKAENLGL